eukprot:COSAG05_NODE_18553_length_306_cov_1.256039_1_plen_44_part_10
MVGALEQNFVCDPSRSWLRWPVALPLGSDTLPMLRQYFAHLCRD